MATLTTVQGATLPDTGIWFMPTGTLLDLSSGYTFTIKCVGISGQTVWTKTTGMSGATGSGDGSSTGDVPNLLVAWASGDLGSTAVTAGTYTLELDITRTADSKVYKRQFTWRVLPAAS